MAKKGDELRERVRAALGLGETRADAFELAGEPVPTVRVLLRGGLDKASVVRCLCRAGLACRPKEGWVDAFEREDELADGPAKGEGENG